MKVLSGAKSAQTNGTHLAKLRYTSYNQPK